MSKMLANTYKYDFLPSALCRPKIYVWDISNEGQFSSALDGGREPLMHLHVNLTSYICASGIQLPDTRIHSHHRDATATIPLSPVQRTSFVA